MFNTQFKVLYIEDNPDDIILFEEYLLDMRTPPELTVARNFEDGFAMVPDHSFDIAFLDLSLPDVSGIAGFTRFNEAYPELPVVILTGLNDYNLSAESLKLGVQDYLVKGEYNELLLEKTILYAIERHKFKTQILHKQSALERAQRQLARSQAKLKGLFDNASEISIIIKDDGKISFCSASIYSILGCRAEDVVGMQALNYLHPEDTRMARVNYVKKLRSRGKSDPKIYRVRHQGGEWKYFQIVFNDQRDNPTIDGVIINAQDVTDLKQAQEEILRLNAELEDRVEYRTKQLESEKRFSETIINSLPGVFFAYDPDLGQLRKWNNNLKHYTGLTNEQLFHHDLESIVSEKDTLILDTVETSEDKGFKSIEVSIQNQNGIETPFLITGSRIEVNGQSMVMGIGFDITRQKRVEEENNKLSQAVIHSPVSIVITDANGKIEYVNPKFTSTTGFSLEEITNHHQRFLVTGMLPEKYFKKVWEQVRTAGQWYGKICSEKKDGEVFWESVSISAIRDQDENITHFVAVKEDVTKRMKMEEELKIAMGRADAANRAKSEFLANMSHEIRTPMNAVMGFSELLSGMVTDDIQKSFLESIKSSSRNLLTLINDILDLSKIEAGKMELQYNYLDPYHMIQEMQPLFTLKVQEKGLDFIIDIDPNVPKRLYLDELRLRQILINLLGNAVKFTEEGHVRLRTSVTQFHEDLGSKTCDLKIEVEDTGKGISPEYLNKLFAPFSQQEGQSTKKYGGTGLGLSITQKLVKLMGGTISVSSIENAGTHFTISLTQIKFSNEDGFDESSSTINYSEIEFQPARVLIVDDIPDNRKFLSVVLGGRGLTVDEAENGNIALKKMTTIKPDLVLTDLKMPEMDGYQLITETRKNPDLKDIPVIATSASVLKGNIDHLEEFSFSGFVMKPIEIEEVLEEISKFLTYKKSGSEVIEFKTQLDELTDLTIHNMVGFDEDFSKLSEYYLELQDHQPIDLSKDFAELCVKVGEDHQIIVLENYGKDLARSIESFDIENMLIRLKVFQEISQRLKPIFEINS